MLLQGDGTCKGTDGIAGRHPRLLVSCSISVPSRLLLLSNSRGSRREAVKIRGTGRVLRQLRNSGGVPGISQLQYTGNPERLKNRGRFQHWGVVSDQ